MADEKIQPLEKKEEAKESFTQLVDRMEKANAEHRELLTEQKELTARNLLGGGTTITPPQQDKKEETPQEYAKRITQGKK